MSPELATSTRLSQEASEGFRASGFGAYTLVFKASAASLPEQQLPPQVAVQTAATEALSTRLTHQEASSTKQPLADSEQEKSQELEDSLHRLAWDARDEAFEDGVESNFARELSKFLALHRSRGLEVLVGLSMRESMEPGVLAEALFAVARSKDVGTRQDRFWLLVASLFHSSPQVRDAAALGLAVMGEKRGGVYLNKAIEGEQIAELKYELERARSLLE